MNLFLGLIDKAKPAQVGAIMEAFRNYGIELMEEMAEREERERDRDGLIERRKAG